MKLNPRLLCFNKCDGLNNLTTECRIDIYLRKGRSNVYMSPEWTSCYRVSSHWRACARWNCRGGVELETVKTFWSWKQLTLSIHTYADRITYSLIKIDIDLRCTLCLKKQNKTVWSTSIDDCCWCREFEILFHLGSC